jgi:hypothetical protein
MLDRALFGILGPDAVADDRVSSDRMNGLVRSTGVID